MQKLLRKFNLEKGNIASILSTSLLSIIASFVMMLAFANLVSTQTLGTYQYIISVVSILGSLSLTGIITSLVRAVSKKEYFFLAYAKKFIFLGSIPSAALGTGIGIYYVFQSNYLLGLGIFVSNIFYLGAQYFYRFDAIYIALNEVKTTNLLLKIHAVAPVIVVLPALFIIKEAHILVVLYFCSIFFSFIIGTRLLKMREKESTLIALDTDVDTVRRNYEYLKFAFHQSVIAILGTASVHLDKVLIFQFLGAQQTAFYFIAISIPNRFRSIIKQFDSYFFARFAKHQLADVQNKITIRFLSALVLIVPFYIIYIVGAPLFFKLFLPQYIDAMYLSQIYAITLFAGALIIPQSVMKAHASSAELYFNSLFFTISKLLFVLSGIYLNGLEGAIIGAAIAFILYTLLSLYSSYKIKTT